jgi:ParB family chromosome partitioning protein
MSKTVLGRGLGAYFGDVTPERTPDADPEKLLSVPQKERANMVLMIPVRSIRPNPHQPRKEFDELRLQELADSIRQHGLIQPITVRYLGEERYELISGERRLRATKMAGIDVIPGYIREANDEESITFAIIENVQREQLNPIEVAMGYQRLIDECDLTQEDVGVRVGKNRTTVTNFLRLLSLPPLIQSALKMGRITTGHARALITIENEKVQEQLLDKIIENDLSVRQVEDAVRGLANKKSGKNKPLSKKEQKDIELMQLANSLRQRLSTKVSIRKKQQGGEIRIEYYSNEDLDRLIHLFETRS